MNKYQNTKTGENLLKAFNQECCARVRYEIYAGIAKKDGFEQLSEILLDISNNEYEHAKLIFKELGLKGNVIETITLAHENENDEWTIIYPKFASVASD